MNDFEIGDLIKCITETTRWLAGSDVYHTPIGNLEINQVCMFLRHSNTNFYIIILDDMGTICEVDAMCCVKI